MTLPFRENNLKLLKFRCKSKFCPNASLKMFQKSGFLEAP